MYNFGQLRRNQLKTDDALIDSYTTAGRVAVRSIITKNTLTDNNDFEDKAVVILGSNNTFIQDAENPTSYYIRFKIRKKTTEQKIKIQLSSDTGTGVDVKIQELDTIIVQSGSENSFEIFEMVITPNDIYTQLQFILSRTIEDYISPNPRIIDLTVENLGLIKNLIRTALGSSIGGKMKLLQIGVQSSPGLGMCINGEMIKVGRSGLYEIKDGIEIYFIGFLIDSLTSENNKYFLLDYQY